MCCEASRAHRRTGISSQQVVWAPAVSHRPLLFHESRVPNTDNDDDEVEDTFTQQNNMKLARYHKIRIMIVMIFLKVNCHTSKMFQLSSFNVLSHLLTSLKHSWRNSCFHYFLKIHTCHVLLLQVFACHLLSSID